MKLCVFLHLHFSSSLCLDFIELLGSVGLLFLIKFVKIFSYYFFKYLFIYLSLYLFFLPFLLLEVQLHMHKAAYCSLIPLFSFFQPFFSFWIILLNSFIFLHVMFNLLLSHPVYFSFQIFSSISRNSFLLSPLSVAFMLFL